MLSRLLTSAAILLLSLSCHAITPVYTYQIFSKYPATTENYTEGFFYLDGLFYEGTGEKGRSAIIVTQPETGHQLQRTDIAPEYFGEGIIDVGPNILEWTWQSHTGFIFDRFSMRQISTFHYTGEGWGMTRTTRELITSDGTSTLRFRNPKSFAET